jgi:thiosulfate/3-mercaptopyruvate sulfurtransferase
MYTTLIDPQTLALRLDDPAWIIVNSRFSLADMAAGETAYRESHIPRAVYAHLDRDLSGPPFTDNGRHPLPTPAAMTALFGRLGIDETKQVVVYDDSSGAVAARLWWMLRYMGHTAVAVLDGGWPAWLAGDYPTRSGVERNGPAVFTGAPQPGWLVRMAEVPAVSLLVDSREEGRYRGETEPIDAKAGRIPGARHYFYQQNVGADGRYLPPDSLRR